MENGCWGREDETEKGYKGGGWSIIRNKIARMERVEHNTTIGHNVMNEDAIEDF